MHHYREIRTAEFAPAATGARGGVLHHRVTVITDCKNTPGTEGNTDATLLAPALVDLNCVHRIAVTCSKRAHPSTEVVDSPQYYVSFERFTSLLSAGAEFGGEIRPES